MNIKIVKVGALYTNCYILSNNVSTIIIDPGDNASKIINNIDKRVIGILITHYHDDHIGALDDLLNYLPAFHHNPDGYVTRSGVNLYYGVLPN